MRQKLLLLAAVFFGILAFIFTYQQISAEKEKIRKSAIQLTVVKLKKTLSAGEVITAENLEPVQVYRSPGISYREVLWNQRSSLYGQKVNQVIQAGTILNWYLVDSAAEETGRGGLAERISEGPKGKVMRAVAIDVSQRSAVGCLVRPNNRVDVIATLRRTTKDASLKTVTLTLLENVKVLACGQDMGDQSASGRSRGYNIVTLEVTPEDAELLVFARRNGGELTLALRRYNDAGEVKTSPVEEDELFQKIQKRINEKSSRNN